MESHEVRNTVIGRFTDNNRYCVVYDEDLTEKHVMELDVDCSAPSARAWLRRCV